MFWLVRMLCSLYYTQHSATMSLHFPRKNITANAKGLGIAKMIGCRQGLRCDGRGHVADMWWAASSEEGDGSFSVRSIHWRGWPLKGYRYKDKTLLDWAFLLQACESWGLRSTESSAWRFHREARQLWAVGCWVFLHVLPSEGSFISPSFQSWSWKHSWLEVPVSNCGLRTTWSHCRPCVYHLLDRQELGTKGPSWARWVEPLSCILTRA